MANTVNLQRDEYLSITAELLIMHEKQLQNISEIIIKLKELVTSAGVFSTDYTSKMILEILDTFSNNVMSLLEQVFQDSEAGVANMISSVITTDSIRDWGNNV